MLLTVNCLGHEVGNQTIKPIQSENEAMHKFETSTSKRELMRSPGFMHFYSKLIKSLQISTKKFLHFLRDNVTFIWTSDLETLLEQSETSLSKDADLPFPNKTHFSACNTVDASSVCLVAVLFQPNLRNQMQVLS